MEEEIVDVNVRLNQAVRPRFSRPSSDTALNFQSPGSYFKSGPLFVGLTWLVTDIRDGKERFCS